MGKKAIFVLGPPNSGKGTQAKLLAEKLGFYHFTTSKEGRHYIDTHDDTETKRQAEIYKKGILWDPEWLIEKVMKERTVEIFKDFDGIVFDGSPRTLFESEKLFEFLAGIIGKENIFVIEIAVPEEELRRRSGERLVCNKDLGHVVSRRFTPDKKEGDRCSKCDGVLEVRDLDKVFDTRMGEYRNRTSPGLDYLKKNHDKIFVIDGMPSPEEIHKNILSKFDL